MAIALALTAAGLPAGEWRTFAGGFSSRWKTVGLHGHDQPYCAEIIERHFPGVVMVQYPNCNPVDFSRGNLDNSIGYRAGRERDFLSLGPLHVVGGGEAAISYTEYNLTQEDFALVNAGLVAGVDLEVGGVRVGGRYGAGPFLTTDAQELGFAGYTEFAVTLPLRPGAAVRLSHRNTETLKRYGEIASPEDAPRSPTAREIGVMFVASPDFRGSSRWEFSTATGTVKPGRGMGSDRMLRQAAFTRFSAIRDLPWRDLQLEVSWNSSAHESVRPTTFRGFGGNFRSKTIDGFGASISRTRPLLERLSLRYGAGLEGADWRDEHQLLTRDGLELRAGIETAMTASVALRYHLAPHVALETSMQKVYWRSIDLGESRWGMGIALTR